MKTVEQLQEIAAQVRRDIIRMVYNAKSGHPGGSLGCTDVVTALFFEVMDINPSNFTKEGRGEDMFFLSNGHISPMLYSIMARRGYFDIKELATFRKLGTRLQGHPTPVEKLPGLRIASGSLGQGLSVSIGAAIAKKHNQDPHVVYTLTGDGELEEGQVWEAFMFAGAKKVDNLIAIIDHNKKQAIAKHNIELEKKLGISKGERMTIDEADKQSANPNYGKSHFDDNCQTCSPAYMLRLHGFNVTAKACHPGSKSDYLSKGRSWEVWKDIDGTPAKHISVNDWMASKGYKQMSPKRYKEFYEENCMEVGVYQTSIKWKGRGGHATILQRLEDGSLLYIEPQIDNSSNRSIDYLCNNGKTSGLTDNRGVMRIDNKLFNTDFIDIFNK